MKCTQPNCKGVDHQGLCWTCPHSDDVRTGVFKAVPWEKTPCFACKKANPNAECDSREQGHDRVISYEEAPPMLVASFPAPDDGEPNDPLRAIVDVLNRLLRLEPKLYVTLIESVRFADHGGQRMLKHVTRVTNQLFRENVSFQQVSARIAAAQRTLRG